MSFNPAEPKSAFERLAANPTGMNWRNEWDPTTQYYLNDVVQSPVNINSYILTGKTALLGGDDPTLNPDWSEVSPATVGVQQVEVDLIGLSLGGTATIPIIKNEGVITLALAPTDSGLLDLGINAQNPILKNDGVLQITQGAGITITGSKTNYTIASSAASSTPIFSSVNFTKFAVPMPLPAGDPTVYFFDNPLPNNAFGLSFANPLSFTGVWCLDLAAFSYFIPDIVLTNPPTGNLNLDISFDKFPTLGPKYNVPAADGGEIGLPLNQVVPNSSPYVLTLGKIWFNVGDVLAVLGSPPTRLVIGNNTSTNIYVGSFQLSVAATYYPNGIQ